MPVTAQSKWDKIKNKPTTLTGFGITDASQLGVGQTWQDVTASRAYGTTYTNSTGKPIEISISCNVSGSLNITLTIGGVIAANGSQGASSFQTSISAIVPAGSTYSCSSSGTPTNTKWSELR